MSRLKRTPTKDDYVADSSKLIQEFKDKIQKELTKYEPVFSIKLEGEYASESISHMQTFGDYEKNGFILLSSDNGIIWKLDPKNSKISVIDNLQKPIVSLKISSKGDFVIVASGLSIHIIGLGESEFNKIIDRPYLNSEVSSIALTRNDALIVTGSTDQVLKVFDVETKACIYSSEDSISKNLKYYSPIRTIAISMDNNYAFVPWGERSILMFHLKYFNIPHEFKGYQDGPSISLAVSLDNNLLVSGSEDGSIAVFRLNRRELVTKFEAAHEDSVNTVALTDDNSYIISCSLDDTIRVFDLERRIAVHTYDDLYIGRIVAVRLNRPSKYLIAASTKNVWIRPISQLENDESSKDFATDFKISEIVLSKDKKTLLATSFDGNIHVYDFQNKNLRRTIPFGQNSMISSVVFTNNPNEIIAGDVEGFIKKFDLNTGELINNYGDVHDGLVYLKICPENGYLYSASEDRSICVINCETSEILLREKNLHENEITGIALYDEFIITAGADKCIIMYNVKERKIHHQFLFYEGYPSCLTVTYSKLENYIICGSTKGTLNFFSIHKLERSVVLQAHKTLTGTIFSVEISSDDAFVFTSSIDGTAKVFDFQRREVIHNLFSVSQQSPFLRIQLSPNDDFLLHYLQGGSTIQTIKNPFSDHDKKIIVTCKELSLISLTLIVNRKHSPYMAFMYYVLHEFLIVKDLSFQRQLITAFPDLRVFPFGWNFFHIVSIFLNSSDLVRLCTESQIPFSRDNHRETPLHYLLEKNTFDFSLINYLMENIETLIPENMKPHTIINSLSHHLPKIITLDTPAVANFLKLSFGSPLPYKEEELPRFGNVLDKKGFKFLQGVSPVLRPEIKEQLVNLNGDNLLSVKMLRFFMDYNILSNDLFAVVTSLNQCKKEDIFKTKAISVLIEYLWQYGKAYQTGLIIFYSQGMILLTIYVAQAKLYFPLEVAIFVVGILYVFYELTQMYIAGVTVYFQDFWNSVDLLTMLMILILPIATWNEVSPFTRSWLMSISIFLGYLRWISFFRVIDQTRRLIRTILEIVKDMRSFVVILVSIIVGFTLIFHAFNPEVPFLTMMDSVYNLTYANFDSFEDITLSEYFFFIIITVALSVVLLNMLVAIMSDTYAKVEEMNLQTDSKEKLSMIIEAMTMVRVFPFLKGIFKKQNQAVQSNKSYLYYAKEGVSYGEDEYDGDQGGEWEGKFNNVKKFMHGEITGQMGYLSKQYDMIKTQFDTIRQEVSNIRNKVKEVLVDADKQEGSPKKNPNSPTKRLKLLDPFLAPLVTQALGISSEKTDEGKNI